MKITFNDEALGTSITTTPDKLSLSNSPEGVVLTFGGYILLAFKGVTVQSIVPPLVPVGSTVRMRDCDKF